jgi:hypothetical protein
VPFPRHGPMDDLYLPPAATPEQASHGSKRMDPMRVACSPIDPSNNSPHLVAWSSCHFKPPGRTKSPRKFSKRAVRGAGQPGRVFSHEFFFFCDALCCFFLHPVVVKKTTNVQLRKWQDPHVHSAACDELPLAALVGPSAGPADQNPKKIKEHVVAKIHGVMLI